MSALKQGRYLVVLVMVLWFLYNTGQSLVKYTEERIGETQGTKKAEEMFFPSLHVCPIFNETYSKERTSGTMNLTEYYENRPRIEDLVLGVEQAYETKNG